MNEEQLKAFVGGRRLAGTIVDEAKNFRFEVWSFRPLSDDEIRAAFRFWSEQRDKRRSLKNQTIRILSNQGFEQ